VRHDGTTVQKIVETMEARHGTVGKVWIMDRGMASAENIAWLRQTGRRHILGTPKSELRKWAPVLADKTHWRETAAVRDLARMTRLLHKAVASPRLA
jgi:hypothetical protein